MTVKLVDMKRGERGKIVAIEGGVGIKEKVQGMGLRIGKEIKKVESSFWRGPQTILVDNFKVAIGFGMATKIFVEVERNEQ